MSLFLKTTTNSRKSEQVWNYASVSIITTRKKLFLTLALALPKHVQLCGPAKRRQTKYSIWPDEIVAKGRSSKAARDACRGLGHPERRFFLRWAGPGDRHAPTGRDSRCVCLQQPADQAAASSQSLGGPTWQRKNTWSERAIDREHDKVPRPTAEQTEPSPAPAGSTTTGPPPGPRDCV